MGDGTLVSILIMVCGMAAGNTLPICSQRICQMIGVDTPHPLRSVCHNVTSYNSVTHRIPHQTSPDAWNQREQAYTTQHGFVNLKKPTGFWPMWTFLKYFLFLHDHIPPWLLPPFPPLLASSPQPHPPPFILSPKHTVLLHWCPINHSSLINRPTVPKSFHCSHSTPGPALLPSRHTACTTHMHTYT